MASTQELPTSQDDPRLQAGWYHTIDLGEGLSSKGDYDLRGEVDKHGLPDSLKGKTALDVGTWDGFWAFELERRGADKVVAIDVERWGDFDWLPWIRESKGEMVNVRSDQNFWLAHRMRNSKVNRKACNIYDLSPETVGTFDVVFCGSLMLHLQNPLKAMVNIRSVTKEMAIITSRVEEEIDYTAPDKPWASFGYRRLEKQLGEECIYWNFSTRGLQEIIEYAGFKRTEVLDPVDMPPRDDRCAVIRGYPED
jgi:tRNA (mo5U34)-methyltransferase